MTPFVGGAIFGETMLGKMSETLFGRNSNTKGAMFDVTDHFGETVWFF